MMDQSTVFVIDDDRGLRRSVTALGRAHGLAVEAYAAAEAFLTVYDAARPGCLLLDVRLAAGNGLELQDELRRRGSPLPVLVITGHGDVSSSVRAFRGGALDFLEKPVAPRVLLERVRHALAVDRQRREAARAREAVARRLARLTTREREVARLLAAGRRSKEVAAAIGISTRTAEGHRRQVLQKMGVGSTAELVIEWMKLHPATGTPDPPSDRPHADRRP
jgi:FixJ family two-component response regulator